MSRKSFFASSIRHLAALLIFMLPWCGACGAVEPPLWNDLSDPVFLRADLPQPGYLTAMAQDRNGFFWLGTQNGLFLWDGYRFHGVPIDPTRRGTLPDGFINVLHKDRRDRLWVGMEAGGLARLDTLTAEPGAVEITPAGQSGMRVLSIGDDARGGLWIGTADGLRHVDSNGAVTGNEASKGAAHAFAGERVNAVAQDGGGALWVGTAKGLFAARADATGAVQVPLPGAGVSTPTVKNLMIDGAGRLWVGTRSHGVYVVERGARAAVQVRDTDPGDRTLEGETVLATLDIGDGRIWVGTFGGGIVEVRTDTWSTRRLRHYQEEDSSLPTDEVNTLLRDIHGRIWVGTGGALSSHVPTQRGIATWFGFGGRAQRLGHPNVDVALAMPDDSVWLGIGEGIEIVHPARGRIGQLEPDPARPRTALPRAHVLAMARADDGGVYIGTMQGLYRADASGRTVRRVEMAGRDDTAPAWAVCASGDRLWLGDLQGLWEIRLLPGDRAELMSHEQAVLGHSHVSSIACGDPRDVWVGTHAGLARYDRLRGTAEWLETDVLGKMGMPRGFITSVRTDARGRLWVSSYGGGARVLESVSAHPPVLHRIGEEEGLVRNAANALLIDSRGDAWVSTDDGLARVAGDTLAVTQLHGADGVGIRSHWTNAAAVTPHGALVFGGVGGFTVVQPDEARPSSKLDRGSATPIFLSTSQDRFVPAGTALQPAQRSLQATFTLLDYAAPDLVRYAYRLRGLEEAWSGSSPDSRTARYTNLPAGDYVLEVKAADHTGTWIQAAWPVHVERAWHETVPARAAFALASLLLAALVVRARTRMLERRAAELGALVASRTDELEERTRQLEVSHEAIRDLGAHNVRALEQERKRVARELHDELGQQLAALTMEIGVMGVRSNGGSPPPPHEWDGLRGGIGQVTASVRRIVAGLRPVALDAGADVALEWLTAEFTRNTGVPCELDIAPGCRALDADRAITVFRVAQESLTNVGRHADARHVRVSLQSTGKAWQLTVSDDGRGFAPQKRQAGYGLLGMQERAGLVGGLLEIVSRPGEGTTVSLTLYDQPPSEASTASSTPRIN